MKKSIPNADLQSFNEDMIGFHLVMDTGFKMVAVCEGYLEATKRARDEVIGRNFFEVFFDDAVNSPTDFEILRSSMERALRNRAVDRPLGSRFSFLRRGESEGEPGDRFWRVTHMPLLLGGHEPVQLIQTLEDITELERLRLRCRKLEQVEDSLNRRCQWYSTTLESIGDAVIATDESGHVRFMNGIAQSMSGWRDDDAEGKPLDQVFRIVNEHTGTICENPVEKVLQTGRVVGLANHTVLIARDGAMTPIDDSAAPIRDREGNVSGVVLVFRDVREKKEAERVMEVQARHAALYGDVGVALTKSGGMKAMLSSCTDLMVRHLDAALARIWKLDESGTILKLQASSGLYTHIDGSHAEVPVGRLKIGRIAAERSPHLTNSVIGDPRIPDQEWAKREGLVSFAGYPLVVANRMVGVMAMFARVPLDDSTLQALASVADEIALGIIGKEAEEELRESEARKTAILDSALDCIITINQNGEIVEFNPAAEKTFGYRRADVLGRQMAELIIPVELRSRHKLGLSRLLKTGKSSVLNTRLELPAMRADGSVFPIELAISQIAGRNPAFTAYIRDLSDRKAADERFRFLAESMPQKIFTAKPDGEIDYFNRQWAEFTGDDVDRMIEAGWERYLHEDDLTEHRRRWKLSIESGEPFQFEHRFRRFDGSHRWHLSRARAMRDDRGEIVMWIGSNTDIDEQKRSGDFAARRSEQLQKLALVATRLAAAHDVGSVLGVVTEESRKLIGAHLASTGCRANPFSPGLVHAVSYSEIYEKWRGIDYQALIESLDLPEEMRSSSRPLRMTAEDLSRKRMKAGSPPENVDLPPMRCWLAVPLVGRSGRNIGLVHLLNKYQGDFTDDDEYILSQLAQMASVALENARLYQELKDNDRRKNEFLAMLAHELRSPLAAIKNAARVSKVTDRQDQINWSLSVIDRQVVNLARLIDDLLDVSRITRGKIRLRPENLDVGKTIDAAVEAIDPLLRARKHELSVSLRPGLRVQADPTRFEQILVNLLSNAAKYTEAGGHIQIEAAQEGGEIVIKVCDDGIGISSENLSRMFELFAQGDRTLARSEGGLGIGLTIVKSLVELHGGSVSAASDGLNQGSRFIVRLPAGIDAPIETTPPPAATVPDARESLRILVVDDNLDTAQGMSRILRHLGHQVDLAHDGHAAIEAAQRLLPQIVLLDIGLPGMDGYQVAAQLKQMDCCKNSKIIAVSGYGQEDDRRRARDAGFDHHLVKPVDHEALIRLIADS